MRRKQASSLPVPGFRPAKSQIRGTKPVKEAKTIKEPKMKEPKLARVKTRRAY